MKKFKNKVAMLVNKGQFLLLSPKLQSMGYVNRCQYIGDNAGVFYIVNEWANYKGSIFSIDKSHQATKDHIKVEPYNEELFLALCAQSVDGERLNVGEWVMRTNGGFMQVVEAGGLMGNLYRLSDNSTSYLMSLGKPKPEQLTKHFNRKAKRSEKIEAIRNEIKHLQSCDWLSAVDLNITGREPVKVLREYAKEAASAAHSAKSDAQFAEYFEDIISLKNIKQIPMEKHEEFRQKRNEQKGLEMTGEWIDEEREFDPEDLHNLRKAMIEPTPLKPRPQPIPRVNRTKLDQIVRDIQEWEDVLSTYMASGGHNKAVLETIRHRIAEGKHRAIEAIESKLIPF